MPVSVSGVVEGITDQAALAQLIAHIKAEPSQIVTIENKKHLLKRLVNYNQAAQFSPWVVLVDLDLDFDCAVKAKNAWLADPADTMCFRIAVRKLEAWFLADRENIARFLGVSVALVPKDPEALDDPKLEMVNLARKSKKRAIIANMVPREGSGRATGIAYAASLIDFASNHWNPDQAAENSESLRRSIECLKRLVEDE
ncbi:MAG: DUF4276 family protein [Anaerolineae bacterium]|nr:DUF4276 family protein [Anaerolineae bacterium]